MENTTQQPLKWKVICVGRSIPLKWINCVLAVMWVTAFCVCLLLAVPWIGLWSVTVVFPDQTHLSFDLKESSVKIQSKSILVNISAIIIVNSANNLLIVYEFFVHDL